MAQALFFYFRLSGDEMEGGGVVLVKRCIIK